MSRVIGPILWGHSGPVCHALLLLLSMLSLWTSILHCHSPDVATVARCLRYSYSWLRLILVVVTVVTPGEWQCKIRTGGVWQLAVGPTFFKCFVFGICQRAVVVCSWEVPASIDLAYANLNFALYTQRIPPLSGLSSF